MPAYAAYAIGMPGTEGSPPQKCACFEDVTEDPTSNDASPLSDDQLPSNTNGGNDNANTTGSQDDRATVIACGGNGATPGAIAAVDHSIQNRPPDAAAVAAVGGTTTTTGRHDGDVGGGDEGETQSRRMRVFDGGVTLLLGMLLATLFLLAPTFSGGGASSTWLLSPVTVPPVTGQPPDNPTATSATDDHGQLPTSTPPLLPAPAPGVSERPPSTDGNLDPLTPRNNNQHHHSKHEFLNFTSRAEWSVPNGFGGTRLPDDNKDDLVHPTHTNPTATSATDDHGQLPTSTPLSPAPDVSWLLPSKTNDILKNDQDQPMNDQDLFHIPRSPQPSAAPVGNDAHMRS